MFKKKFKIKYYLFPNTPKMFHYIGKNVIKLKLKMLVFPMIVE